MWRRGCASAMGMIKFPSSCSSPKALCNQFIDYYICSRGVQWFLFANMDFNCRLYCWNDGHNALAFMCWYQFKNFWRISQSVLMRSFDICRVVLHTIIPQLMTLIIDPCCHKQPLCYSMGYWSRLLLLNTLSSMQFTHATSYLAGGTYSKLYQKQ